ncbi:MAG: hypothetical protein U0556_16020 [Dehalococcoidia bacterium]
MRSPGCFGGLAAFLGLGGLGLLFLYLDWSGGLPPVIGASIGVILLIIAGSIPVVVLLVQTEAANAELERVRSDGATVRARLVEVDGNRGSFRVTADAINPVTGQPCRFVSATVAGTPSDERPADLLVAVDWTDPTRAVIDLGGLAPDRFGWARCIPQSGG